MSLRAAVIGLGVGAAHAAAYAAHPDCELVALCDLDPERLEEVGARYPGAGLTTEAGEILDDPEIDLVSIASYDSFHHEQVKRALEAGKHVFCEKPLCTRYEHAAEIHSLLRQRPELKLSSNLPLRRVPRFRLVKDMIEDGAFGRLFYVEGDYDYGRLWKLTEGWRGDLEHYSVVLGGAVHLVDLLLWLTGDIPVAATASGSRIATEGTKFSFNDLVVATVEFESGLIAKVGANFACVHPHYHGVKVYGTDATFVNGLEGADLYRKQGSDYRHEQIAAPYPGVEKGDLIPSFVESIRTGTPAEVTADEIFDALAACFAIDEAVETGVRVLVKRFR